MDMNYQMIDRTGMDEILDVIPEGQEFALRVTGYSMVPFFLNRISTVFLVRRADYVPHVGDVVFFKRLGDGAYVLHRVNRIRTMPDGRVIYVINGDAQSWREVIFADQIVAHVTHFIRTKKDYRMDSFRCRCWAALWRPLRFMHPFAARMNYYWRRLPYKLGLKKDK